MRYQVWAPRVRDVALRVDDETLPMTLGEYGWWNVETWSQEPGPEYGFILDGQGPYPDPRSHWQPGGVHSLSRRFDHSKFEWQDSAFQPPPLAEAILYELHIGTFTPQGTFLAAIEKLGHLVALGVTHVELMPIASFPGSFGWGYDGVALFAPHCAYGGPEDLKRLVAACHSLGLAVLLDVVYNHFGPTGNHLARYGPYFTKRYSNSWGLSLNFDDADNDEVRRFLCDNALMWLHDYHFDGLRLDAVHAIIDISARHFLEQLADEVGQLEVRLGRKLVLIAESDLNAPRLMRPADRGGYGLDAQWNDDFHHALHAFLTQEKNGYYADFGSLASLAKGIGQGFVYDGCYSQYRRCHFGRPAPGLSGEQLIGYLQNHDQVGNRAQGERSSQLLSSGRLKIGAALVLASPFVPMLFQGEEWAASTPFLYFADHEEPELAKAVREGRLREFASFGWRVEDIPDPVCAETFQRSKLDWSEPVREKHKEILDWHQQLIRLRRAEPCLQACELSNAQVRFHEEERWLVVERGPFSVVCNFASRSQTIPVRSGVQQTVLNSGHPPNFGPSGAMLEADSVTLIRN